MSILYGCNFNYDLAVVLSLVLLKERRTELHINTKSKAIGTKIADIEMIQILAVCG